MDKRINLELRGRQPSKLKELDLSGCKTGGEIEGLTEEFESLEFLDFSNSNITNLKTFPKLPNLRKLDFSGNRLSKGLENLKTCTNLKHLMISRNRFRELDILEPLKSLEHLTHLDVGIDIPGVDQPQLRLKVFELLPNLQYLDGYDIDGNEEDDDAVIPNGMPRLDDDVSDGDDELEDEEGEEEEEDDEDSDEGEGETGIEARYVNGVVLQEDEDDEDYNEDASEDEDDEVEEDEEPEQSTRGKKRKLDDGTV
eukprot:GFUD01020713.1.p1 GENE.GFUD01020713.1~~GFUD01020713.1.p1  ORF type:complete len:254 (-),score=81.08 GFUD01020713.1:1476-2237(-)